MQTILSIVGAVDSDRLLCYLPAVDQEPHKSRTQPLGCSQPKFYWIFKNIDFDQWHHTNGRAGTQSESIHAFEGAIVCITTTARRQLND